MKIKEIFLLLLSSALIFGCRDAGNINKNADTNFYIGLIEGEFEARSGYFVDVVREITGEVFLQEQGADLLKSQKGYFFRQDNEGVQIILLGDLFSECKAFFKEGPYEINLATERMLLLFSGVDDGLQQIAVFNKKGISGGVHITFIFGH